MINWDLDGIDWCSIPPKEADIFEAPFDEREVGTQWRKRMVIRLLGLTSSP